MWCKSLTSVVLPQSLTSLGTYFLGYCDSITEYTVPKWIKAIGSSCFYAMAGLKRLIFEDGYSGKYSSSFLFCNTAFNCPNLEYIYLPASIDMDDSLSTSSSYHIGGNCPKLEVVELGQGYSYSLNLSFCTKLTHDCLVSMLNALADLTGGTAKKLTLGSTNLAKLTDEEKAIATSKNWTLS